jgi:hypothetical protein
MVAWDREGSLLAAGKEKSAANLQRVIFTSTGKSQIGLTSPRLVADGEGGRANGEP